MVHKIKAGIYQLNLILFKHTRKVKQAFRVNFLNVTKSGISVVINDGQCKHSIEKKY